ncbi:hypothetical protein T06_8988 [Trichinella sp. T6]|nr:hypothetical protein T06_8988 [Trichinella sp. T6]
MQYEVHRQQTKGMSLQMNEVCSGSVLIVLSSQPPPKKLDVGKKRLVRLLGELNQLLEEEAAVPLIEEQLRMLEEHYRQIEELQAKARALITEKQARDEVPRSTRTEKWKVRQPRLELPKFHGAIRKFQEFWDQLEVSVHEQADLSNATNLAYLRRCLTMQYEVHRQQTKGMSLQMNEVCSGSVLIVLRWQFESTFSDFSAT